MKSVTYGLAAICVSLAVILVSVLHSAQKTLRMKNAEIFIYSNIVNQADEMLVRQRKIIEEQNDIIKDFLKREYQNKGERYL